MSGNCEDGWDISTQEDLDAIFEEANACDSLPKFNLNNATGSILFPSVSDVKRIAGTLWKDFDILNLTDVDRVDTVELAPTPSPPDETVFGKRVVLPSVNMYYTTYCGHLTLIDRDDAPPLECSLYQVTSLEEFEIVNLQTPMDDAPAGFLESFIVKNSLFSTDLESVFHLEVSDMGEDSHLSLYSLDWATSAYFSNISTDTIGLISPLVEEDLYLENSEDLMSPSGEFYGAFTSVGSTLLVRNNARVDGRFDKLTSANNITVQNTIDSNLSWASLEEVATIDMRGNLGTKIPGDMDNLEFADNIYLNGEIMTDLGPNIFPALRRVDNSVTVEAWNEDFDCRTLVAQWEMGIIKQLFCNGTNGHINSSHVSPKFVPRDEPAPVRLPVENNNGNVFPRRGLPPVSFPGEKLESLRESHAVVKEAEGENDPWKREPCNGAFGGVNGILTVALVLGILGLVFMGFRRRRQQQRRRQLNSMAEKEGLLENE